MVTLKRRESVVWPYRAEMKSKKTIDEIKPLQT